MPLLWTLQRYIFRELAKTFLLTAVALTTVLGLGGGVMNMVKLGEVTPAQLVRLMGLILPVSAALTLPLAALFSAAATYGRLSADNEFVACRGGGINLHVLFLPTLALSLFGASVTFAFSNYLIPGMVRNLNEFIGADVGTFIRQRLNRPRGITLGGRYRTYADENVVDASSPDRVALNGVAFVEVEGEEWLRFGTARQVQLDFERGPASLRVSGKMLGLSFYDRQRQQGRFGSLEELVFPPNEVATLVPPQIKFLTLGEILYYHSRPQDWIWVREKMQRLRSVTARKMIYDHVVEQFQKERKLTLNDQRSQYRLQADTIALVPRGGGVEFTGVSLEETKQGKKSTFNADRAIVEMERGDTITEGTFTIAAYQVRAASSDRASKRAKETFGPVAVPPAFTAGVEQLTDEQLLSAPPVNSGVQDPVEEARAKALEERDDALFRLVGTIHERLAFSVSVFVLVILGAALGIILRGAHVLIAFGISFVPTLLVIITIVTGKQMAGNASTHILGLMVIWSGIAVVAGLDVWTLTRVLRR